MYYFILGDINIDTSASPTTKSVNEYLNMLLNSVASIIVFTRVTEFSSTTLSHIVINKNCYQLTSIVVGYDLIDHYLIIVIVSKKFKSSCDGDKPIFKRSFAEFSPVNFNQELHDCFKDFLPRNVTINENDFDQLFNKFHFIITQTIDKHAPLKKSNLEAKMSPVYAVDHQRDSH